jgi:hypothetical protein
MTSAFGLYDSLQRRATNETLYRYGLKYVAVDVLVHCILW